MTGELPEKLRKRLLKHKSIPGTDLKPVLLSPAKVLAVRPDIRAASAFLKANTSLSKAAIAEIYPQFNLAGFYGIAQRSLSSVGPYWNITLGTSWPLINFGRIQGNINVARARELQAFEQYRKTVFEAVSEVEVALNDYARTNQRLGSLKHSTKSARKAFVFSKQLYKEGEISFLNVLDSQRTVNSSEATQIIAEAEKAKAMVRVYKSLGVY